MKKDKLFTVPNMLSISRFFLAGLLFYFIITHQVYFSFATYFLAMTTDFFDGLLARRSGVHSRIGYYLDAYADNTLIALTFLGLLIAGTINIFEFSGYLLIVTLTTAGFFLAPSKKVFYASFDKAYMKKIGAIFIMLFIVSGILELPITSPYISTLSFTVLLTTSSVFLYHIIKNRRENAKA